ncbi:MAG: hypothetical protein HQ555_11755 [Candidatus Aminicenantes bacterium]|nr:hypothetical protein [Candidatus Aminicenantes bacterium]
MPKGRQEIIDDIKEHIDKSRFPYSSWYVGISKDARDRLFNGHKVNEKDAWWIYRQASSTQTAREIEDYFVNTLGTDGGPGGGDEDADMVYAYKKESYTEP